jgi:pyruvate/2-oxoglutarate dehydrogenase complex dihydrolipoamide dehydrogenase (E3) component
MLERGGVKIHLGKEMTGELVMTGRPDAVILSSGALPTVPEIPGIHGDNVYDARTVLLGEVELESKAVVLGAGYVGLETADYLISRDVEVTVVEMQDEPPVTKLTAHGYWLNRRLRKSGGILLLGATVKGIEPGAVIYVKDGVESRLEPASMVVTALGAASETRLVDALEEAGIPCQVVGDAVSPRRLLEAVHEGHAAGLAL